MKRLYRFILRLVRYRGSSLRHQRSRAMRLQRLYDAGLIETFAADVEDTHTREQLRELARQIWEGSRISLAIASSTPGGKRHE